jgi:hypothetical protein
MTEQTDETFDEPTDVSAIVLNFRAECVQRKALGHDGTLLDLEAFKQALVSSLKKSIVVKSLAEYERLGEQGLLTQPILTQIMVYIAWRDDSPTQASLRRGKLPADATITTHVARMVGDSVCLVGEPALQHAQQEQMFLSLVSSVAGAQIFDDEPPAVAAALRGSLDRR